MKKKIYVVHSSDDGMIGVFSNIKKAYDVASKYCSGYDDILSYSQVCNEFKNRKNYDKWGVELRDIWGHDTNAEITRVYLNEEC